MWPEAPKVTDATDRKLFEFGNLLLLCLFGHNVEDALGTVRFLI